MYSAHFILFTFIYRIFWLFDRFIGFLLFSIHWDLCKSCQPALVFCYLFPMCFFIVVFSQISLGFFVISDDFVFFFATPLCWLNYGMYYSKRAEWRTTRLFLILYLVFLGMKMCILFEYLRHIFLFICNILYKLIWLNLTSFLASHKIHQAWE